MTADALEHLWTFIFFAAPPTFSRALNYILAFNDSHCWPSVSRCLVFVQLFCICICALGCIWYLCIAFVVFGICALGWIWYLCSLINDKVLATNPARGIYTSSLWREGASLCKEMRTCFSPPKMKPWKGLANTNTNESTLQRNGARSPSFCPLNM